MKRKILISFGALSFLVFATAKFTAFNPKTFRSDETYPFSTSSEEVPPALTQSFNFLGRGVQCFAFLGEDGSTVLKVFNHRRRDRKRMVSLLQSAEIAATIPDLTGVFYIHLGKSGTTLGKLTLCCPNGHPFTLDMDKTEFILQKKAILAETHLKSLFERGRVEEAIASMQSLISLVESRSAMGIKKRDGKILKNCGFIDGKAIEIDIGSYRYRSSSTNPNPHQKAAIKSSLELLNWVRKNFPGHVNACKKELLDEQMG